MNIMSLIFGAILVGYLLSAILNKVFNKKTEKNPYGKGGIVLTEEQKERYRKELESDRWRKYSSEYGGY